MLFADLVGFTAFSETLDPERAKHVVDRYFERLVADVNAFGGKIDKIVGDGLLALFGAPTAHEDDAERAVRAGLRMQRTVQRMSQELDLTLELRIGINTGEVLVGASQAGTDYTAMGDTVNAASRLEALAQPGEVWVGPETYELTRDSIQYESRGEITVRGRTAVIGVNAAQRELTLPGRRRRHDRAPLVGRDTEMAVLQNAIADSAERGHAYLLMVLGDAGMGKGRIVGELVLAAESQHDAFVLEGRCLPYGETSPWWPIGEALRDFFQVENSDTDDEVAARVTEFVTDIVQPDEDVPRIVLGLRYLMGDEALSELDRSRSAQEATRALQQFLAAHGRERPVMLVLYDLQWGDRVLLDMLERLLEGLRETPFVAITTNRWTSGEERWTGKAGRHNTVLLNLLPLSERSTARLASALLGSDVPEYMARDLYERSGGNPFFLEELTALMSEATSMPAGRRMDVTGPIVRLPDTLRGLVAARIDGLPPDERSMVDEASVIGVDGPIYALLLYLESKGIENPSHAFDQLVTKDIFETDGHGWRFRSDLVREVAYATLTKTARIQRHSVIADWLERRLDAESTRLRDVARVAYHYSAASKLAREFTVLPSGVPDDLLERTLVALERAGEMAQRVDSNFSAGKSFHRLLKLTPDDQLSRRAGAHLGRAAARLSLREMVGAQEDAQRALALAVEAEDSSSEARALILLAEVEFSIGSEETARVHVDGALAIAVKMNDEDLLADALRESGFIHLRQDSSSEAEADLTQALELCRKRDDKAGEGWCLQNLAWLAFQHGEVQEAERRLQNSIELFKSVGDEGGLGWAYGLLAHVRFYQGEAKEAERLASSVLAEAKDRGDAWGHGMISILLASISLWSGRTQEAVERATLTLGEFERIDDVGGQVQALSVLGRAQMASGNVAEAKRSLLQGIDIARTMPGHSMLGLAYMVAIGAAVQSGDSAWAAQLMDEVPEGTVSEAIEADRSVALAMAKLQLGELDALDDLAALVSDDSDVGTENNLRSCIALMYAVRGDCEDALLHSQVVISSDKATYLDRRTSYLAKGLAQARAGDVEGARATFDEAIILLDSTQSLMSQAVVRLAQATAMQHLGTDDADALSSEAERRLFSLNVTAQGWRQVFSTAVGSEPILA